MENVDLREKVLALEKIVSDKRTEENIHEIQNVQDKLSILEDELNTIKGSFMIQLSKSTSSIASQTECTNTKQSYADTVRDNMPSVQEEHVSSLKQQSTRINEISEQYANKIETVVTAVRREKPGKANRHSKATGDLYTRKTKTTNTNAESRNNISQQTFIGRNTRGGRILNETPTGERAVNNFTGSYRGRTKRYYVGGISEDSTVEGFKEFLTYNKVKPVSVRMFYSRNGDQAAQVTVPAKDSHVLEDRSIWPDFVHCRRWYGKQKWDQYRREHSNYYRIDAEKEAFNSVDNANYQNEQSDNRSEIWGDQESDWDTNDQYNDWTGNANNWNYNEQNDDYCSVE